MRLKETVIDQAFVALSDPIRRSILQQLAKGESRVTQLAAPFSISLNSVSKHIRLLERARLVRRRKRGREHILSLHPRGLDEVSAWIKNAQTYWVSKLDALDELLKHEDRAPRRRRS